MYFSIRFGLVNILNIWLQLKIVRFWGRFLPLNIYNINAFTVQNMILIFICISKIFPIVFKTYCLIQFVCAYVCRAFLNFLSICNILCYFTFLIQYVLCHKLHFLKISPFNGFRSAANLSSTFISNLLP